MKRLLVLLGVLLLTGTGLFAAGGQQAGSGTQQAGTGAKTVVHVAHFYDPAAGGGNVASMNWLNKVKDAFEKENPNATIEWEYQQWDQIDVKMISDFRSGITAHDVTFSSPQLFPLHAAVGTFADLSPFVNRDWSPTQIADLSWSSNYQQGLIGGKQIALPLGNHARVLIWNKDLFRAAGLDPNVAPKNIDELIQFAQKANNPSAGIYGFGMPLGPNRATIEISFLTFLWGYGGDCVDPNTKAAVFANDTGVKTAQLLWDMMNTYKIIPPDAVTNTFDIGQYFTAGKVAMAIGWGAYYTNLIQDNGWAKGLLPPQADAQLINVGVALNPTPTNNVFANAWDISIYGKSQNKELAWKFIQDIFKSDLSQYQDAGLPIQKAEWQKPEYQTDYFQTFYKAIQLGKPVPQTPYYGDLADTISAALQTCFQSPRSDIQRILQDAQQQYNSKAR